MDVDAKVVETEVVLGFGSLSCYAAAAADPAMAVTTAVVADLAETTAYGSSSCSSAAAVLAAAIAVDVVTTDVDATMDADAANA